MPNQNMWLEIRFQRWKENDRVEKIGWSKKKSRERKNGGNKLNYDDADGEDDVRKISTAQPKMYNTTTSITKIYWNN